MRYIKIFIIALMDIIVDVYDKRRRYAFFKGVPLYTLEKQQ